MKNKYEIRDNITVIYLNRMDGTVLETIIDTSDLSRAMEIPCSWVAGWSNKTNSFYVMISAPKKDGKRKTIMLNRWLFGELEKGIEIDHFNHDTLDNRRSTNLKQSTKQENQQNRIKSNKDNKHSEVTGITWRSDRGRWRVRVMIEGKTVTIGHYKDYAEAEVNLIKARSIHLSNSQEAIIS